MSMILEKKSKYLFKLVEYFDVCYYDEAFIVKSKKYCFSIANAVNDEMLLSLLKSYLYKGNVIFDCLMSNGLKAHNRFLMCYFDGLIFDWKSLKVINIKNDSVHNIYYKDKNNINIKSGILSNSEITDLNKS